MLLKKLVRYYHTIKFLKWSQVVGRFTYRFKRTVTDYGKYYKHNDKRVNLRDIKLKKPIVRNYSFKAPCTFIFINIEHTFDSQIDWNFSEYGKLWTYNLNYFDFINQKGIKKEDALQFIRNYVQSEPMLNDGKEPYPVSLRLINWIKFLQINNINDQEINDFIFGDLKNLEDNLEYHLQGNHLLENVFALTIGGNSLGMDETFIKGKSLLLKQLAIQVCNDGAHYELSPMYHQILLDRLLDTINIIGYNQSEELIPYAEKMLSWLENISFTDGAIPLVSDSAPGIAPTTKELSSYANRLGILSSNTPLKDSGYRVFSKDCYECLVDGGDLGPEYHTGHGHSDASSFILNVDGKQIIIDTSISTYEENERRLLEKSVVSHNTTHPKDLEPSEMWKSFRVGRREKVEIVNDDINSIDIKRTYPYRTKYIGTRKFVFSDNQIEIVDEFNIQNSSQIYYAYLHFDPDIRIDVIKNTIVSDYVEIVFEGAENIQKEKCFVADGYNNLVRSCKVVIQFKKKLQTNFKIID